jgi:hypothetical protein
MSDRPSPSCAAIWARAAVGLTTACVFWWLAVHHPWYTPIPSRGPAPTTSPSPYVCQTVQCTGQTTPPWKGEPHDTP